MPIGVDSGTDITASDRANAVSRFLTSKNLAPTSTWLRSFLDTTRDNVPVLSMQQTALFKLLSSDITATVQTSSSSVFPTNANDPQVQEIRLPGPIVVQVLDVEDIGNSVSNQIEAIESQQRGESTRGGEVIRTLPEERNEVTQGAPVRNTLDLPKSHGPHKLVLQDAAGMKLYAFELKSVKQISCAMSIGSKLALRNLLIARGMALLEPSNVEFLGGRVEAWDTAWKASRLERLKQKIRHDGADAQR